MSNHDEETLKEYDGVLDALRRETFQYFVEEVNPENGLVRVQGLLLPLPGYGDRATGDSLGAIDHRHHVSVGWSSGGSCVF